ncbi:hypothetical protein P3X46_008402 [Hevea brasiliensis]|uniref:EGF-like domain-containing protein n=1 Tax=Hevea brasiliensis TaxID=3981 RepID=A0ABQ9MKH3_HEVBR|nr:uncharacterized protein LOC110656766 [Hevea brasiliensis]KAJ9180120.1 hypothetical protein P3X46_008402 [Hevea brasiliensis]
MAFFRALPLLALLLALLPVIALGDDPLTPYIQAICDEVECGQGKCVANIQYPFGYMCQCDRGWTRTTNDDINDNLTFLPCVIPNCTLNYGGCQQTVPNPPSEKPVPWNASAFDPCYWIYCGGGNCTRNATYTHLCTCHSGFSNLLNVPYFPCYSQCTLGSDCASLGIKVSNTQATNNTAGGSSAAGNHGSSILPGKFHWMIILFASMLMVLRM